ncbi:hypothetical protein QFZ76_009359 [Streptomyces sp. V4I2]|nr:hypothetical protein [Streptomyces sp. V4I2]
MADVDRVDREDQAPVGGPRHGQADQYLPQPQQIDVPAVQGLVHGSVYPRRCSATSVRSTGALTGPSAHSTTSTSSNSSSPRGQAMCDRGGGPRVDGRRT